MNEPTSELTPVEHNPFQAPNIESIEVDTPPNLLAPSTLLVWTCVILGGVLNLIHTLQNWERMSMLPFVQVFGWIIPQVLMGCTLGLGMALLINMIYRNQLANLMPGHWRLIAASTALVGELGKVAWVAIWGTFFQGESFIFQVMLEQGLHGLLAATFYFFVVRQTRETKIWQVYAWLCLVYFALTIVTSILTPLMISETPSNFWAIYIAAALAVQLVGLGIILVLVVAVALDYRRKVPRDLYHYLGVVLLIVLPLLQWAISMASLRF